MMSCWVTPLETKMTLENLHVQIGKACSNGGFSIVIGSFWWHFFVDDEMLDIFCLGAWVGKGMTRKGWDVSSKLGKAAKSFMPRSPSPCKMHTWIPREYSN